MAGKRGPSRRDTDPIGAFVRNDTLRRGMSVLLTVALVLQNLSYMGLATPAYAEEAVPEEVVVYDATSDEAADATAEEATGEEAADEEAVVEEEAAEASEELVAQTDGSEEQAGEAAEEQDETVEPQVDEAQEEVAPIPTLTSLSITNKTTESKLASSAVDNHLVFEVAYEGLEPGAPYELRLELMDTRTPEAAEAQRVLLGEPDEDDDDHQEPFAWTTTLAPAEASGTATVDLERVDLHWVAGAAYPVRATLSADGAQVAQRTWDAEGDARLYVPGIASALTSAGVTEVAAEGTLVLVDTLTVSGLPREAEATVVGAAADDAGEAVAAGSATVKSDKDGVAKGEVAYPEVDASALAGKKIGSALTITATTADGTSVTVAQYPNTDEKRYEKEADAQKVTVAAAEEAANEKQESDEAKSAGTEASEEQTDEAGQLTEATADATEQAPAEVELDPSKPFEEVLDPLATETIKADASVSYGKGGTIALTLEGEAKDDPAKALEILSKKVGRGEALMLAAAGNAIGSGSSASSGTHSSTSETLDGITETVGDSDKMVGDNNIELIQVMWITEDEFTDGDDSLLSLRPGSVANRDDAYQAVVAQIDYAVSGEKDYAAGDIRIMVPKALFEKRAGGQAGGTLIPLAQSPSKADDFNWSLMGDYYVFTNTKAMSAATKGFIQVMWVNLRPHEIEDAYVNTYDHNSAKEYNEGASHPASEDDTIESSGQTDDWYAYIEVDTAGGTLRAVSNSLRAQMDTGTVATAGYKRTSSNSPYVLAKDEMPAGSIPEQYADEEYFVVVDWYTYAHYNGNQPYTLDISDSLNLTKDQAANVTKDGFIYKISSQGDGATYSAEKDAVSANKVYSGNASGSGDTSYIHVYSAYPHSQFEEGVEYTFHNDVEYTLNPIDKKDTPTKVKASGAVSFKKRGSGWEEPVGHFNVFKWGNDGWVDQAKYSGEYDYVAHNPGETSTISRRGYQQHYNGWYGIYKDAINALSSGDEASDGEPVRLWYTIKSEGWVLPWTVQEPDNIKWVTPEGGTGEAERCQWARWDETQKKYVADKPSDYSPTEGDGYELVEFYRIQDNYLRRPVTMVTTDLGLKIGGTTLVPGSDYTFDYLEFDKPKIGKLMGININKGDPMIVKTNQDGTYDYAEDTDYTKIPDFDLYVEVNGEWQETPYAKVSWTTNSPVITSGGEVVGATLALPEGTTNFRTTVTTTQNAYYMEWIYPGVTLTPDGVNKLHDVAKSTFTDSEGNTVYQPVMWVANGVEMDAYEYDNAGTTKVETPIVHIEKWGSDKLTGYTADMGVYPTKTAKFDMIDDVSYETRTATVHYTAKVEERTFISDRETYDRLTATTTDENGNEVPGAILRDTKGVWYDLLPEGMMLKEGSIKVRSGDTVTKYKTDDNWNNTGRTLLTVWVDQTPAPKQYSVGATRCWEDVPTISFDAIMNLETWTDLGGNIRKGITAHNVVAYETQTPGATELGSMTDHSGEPDVIDKANGNNIRTREGAFTEEEISATENLDETTDNPVFVYADATTKLAFPTAGRTSLSKNIMVDEDGKGWSQGTYDDERTVSEGGIYHYRLRMRSDASTKSKDLVLYDTIENYIAVDGNDPADVGAPRWRGKFAGYDVSQLEEMGVAPVVYYSTEDNLVLTDPDNNRRSNPQNCNIDNSSVWVKADEYTGDLADVHAIAVDCRTAQDGSEFILEPNNSLIVILTMRAPWGRSGQWDDFEDIASQYEDGGTAGSYIEADAHAYNNVYLESVSVAANAEFPEGSASIKDFIRYDYTKVGLRDYNVPVEKVWDDDEDRDGIRAESIEVALYANGELADEGFLGGQPNTVTLDESNDWSASFEHVPYTDSEGKKVSYTVREVDTPEGYSAYISGSVADGFTVTNRHIPERTSLTGTKTWKLDEDDLTTRPSYVDIQLYADGELQQTVRITPENEYDEDGNLIAQKWPTYTFKNLLKYRDQGQEIVYTVRESMPGTAYSSSVKGTDVTNTYHPYGDVSLTKKVQGHTDAIADKEYEFTVKIETPLTDAEGNPVTDEETGEKLYEPLLGEYAWESSDGTTGTVSDGGKLMLEEDEKITVKELPHGTRVTFTESEMPGFTASSNGVVSTTVNQNRDRALTVTNTYRATGQVNLKAFKNLEGRDLTSGKFTFELLDEEGKVLTSAANLADGSVTFDARTYSNKDDGNTYTYTIREQVPADAKNADGVAWADATEEQKAAGGFTKKGVTYDGSTLYTAKVEVNDLEGKGELDVEATYYDAEGNKVEEPAQRAFNNEYHATGETQMTAWKVMEDGGLEEYKLKEDQFQFQLVPVGGADAEGQDITAKDVTMPVDEDGNPISQLKGNDAAGTVRFDKVAYTEADAGNSYYYAATEIVPDDATKKLEDGTTVTWADATLEQRAAGGFAKDNIIYSSAVFGYKVDITDNGDGTLSVTQTRVAMSYDADGNLVAGEAATELPVFRNSVEHGGFTVAKLVEGETDPSQEFTFRIKLKGDDVDPNATYEYDLVRVGAEDDPVAVESTDDTKVNLPAPLQFVVDLFTPKEAQAATQWYTYRSNGSSIRYMIDDDETLIVEPISGDTGILQYVPNGVSESNYPSPWFGRWANSTNWSTATVNTFKSVKVPEDKTIICRNSMYSMFLRVKTLETVDLSGFDFTQATTTNSMFSGCSNLTSINWGNWNAPNLTSTRNMFYGCSSLESIEFPDSFSTTNVTNMNGMFNACSTLTSLEGVENWNTSSVTSMQSMFNNCSSLTDIQFLSEWDTSSVTNMSQMFRSCTSLADTQPLSNWDVSSATTMNYMFSGTAVADLEGLANWDVSSAKSMTSMFQSCKNLAELNDLANWDTSSLTTMDYMFAACENLESIDLSNFDKRNVTNDAYEFTSCSKLKEVKLGPNWRFVSSNGLLPTPSGGVKTGKWIRIDENGDYYGEAYDPYSLRTAYNANPEGLAGTWVPEEVKIEIVFKANGGEGVMNNYRVPSLTFKAPENQFTNELAEFRGWDTGWSTDNTVWCLPGDTITLKYYKSSLDGHIEYDASCARTPHVQPIFIVDESRYGTDAYAAFFWAVWRYTKYSVSFDGNGGSGSMGKDIILAADDYTIPQNEFYWFKHKVVGWEATGVDKDNKKLTKRTFALGETIPSGTFNAGDKVTLKAIWEDADTTAEANNGEFEITLHDGERAVFDDIPAGTEVEIYEKTPDGWVLVSPENNLVTGTVKPNEYNPNAVFTNKKVEKSELKGEVTLDAVKLLKDLDGNEEDVAAGQFSFRLYEDGKLLQTVSNAENGAITFDTIKYMGEESVGTHTYTIEEVAGDDATIKYASDPITAKVTVEKVTEGEGDEAKEVLKVSEPEYTPADKTFVNQRIPEETPESHTLSVTKVAEGIAEDQKPTFTFEVTITDGRGMPISGTFGGYPFDADGKATITIEGAGTVNISGLPEGTIYSVSEVKIPRGWAKISEDNTQSTLNSNAEATFTSVTNQYSSSGLIQLEAYKALDGGQIEEGQFQFGLYDNAACEGEPLQVKANGVVDTNEKVLVDGELVDNPAYNKARVSFDPITIEDARTYTDTYYIREIAGDDPAVTYDTETIITATVTAVDNGKGNIETTVTYSPEAKTITNTENPGSLAISKQVLYAGASATTKAFPVTVALTDAKGNALEGEFAWTSDRAGVEGGTIANGGELQIHGDETITITGLPAGAQYELTEGEVDDYTQESAEGTTGTIVAAETAKASFTNAFHKGTSVTLEATKRLEGGKLVAGAFTFQLLDAEGNVLSEKTNEADGSVTFDELAYAFSEAGTAEDPAVFEYTIKEVVPDPKPDYVNYDSSVYGATVTLANVNGTLETEVTYKKGDDEAETPEFVNEYTAAGSWVPDVEKVLEGHDLTKDQFTFSVARPSGAPLSSAYNAVVETDDEGNITQVVKEAVTELTAKNDADGKVVFAPIAFTQEDVGKTITYIVGEKDEAQAGITYDVHYYRVDVKITDNEDGTLKAEPVKTAGSKTFTNEYLTPAKGEILVKKTLTGRAWKEGDSFTFTIKADKGNPDATAVPANSTVTVTSADAVSFGKITFNKAGSYKYTIFETKGDLGGVTYDETAHEVFINVEAKDGALVAKEDSNLFQTAEVKNTYDAKGSTDVSATKAIEGRAFHDGDKWTFNIEAVDGAPLPVDAKGNELSSVDVEPTADATVEFGLGTFAYELSDLGGETSKTFEYKISESGTIDGVTNDGSTLTLKIAVSDNGDGTLKVEKTEDSDELSFTNTYESAGSYSLGATKALASDEALTEGQFEFTCLQVADAEGNTLDGATPETAANDADGNVSFATVDLTQDDFAGVEAADDGSRTITRYYAVSEVIPEGAEQDGDDWVLKVYSDSGVLEKSITYDGSAYIVTVTAVDDGKGTITVTTDMEPTDVLFQNTVERHDAGKAEATPIASKRMTDSSGKTVELAKGAFTFELVYGGEVVATATNEANGVVRFDTLEYGPEDAGKTFEYTIREAVPTGAKSDGNGNYTVDDITYDGHSERLTVTVTASEDGTTLSATTDYESSDGARFTNVKSEKKGTKKKQKLVKTSDLASPLLPQLVMLGSALTSAGVVLKRRRRRH